MSYEKLFRNRRKKRSAIAVMIIFCIVFGGIFFILMPIKEVKAKDWYDFDWQYSKKIIIDHTKIGSPLINFPILFDNTSADYAHANANGSDFIFVSYDNTTKYNFEIESYNSVTHRLIAWVNITYISSTEDTILWLYYGKPTSPPQQNVAGTWNANYKMVQHMTGAAYTNIDDSTANHNDVTGLDNTPALNFNVTGIVGKAVNFTATTTSNCNNLQFSTSVYDDAPVTAEAWAYPTKFNTGNYMVVNTGSSAIQGWQLDYDGTTGMPYAAIHKDSTNKGSAGTDTVNKAKKYSWNYIAFVWSGTDKGILYANKTAKTLDWDNKTVTAPTYTMLIGSAVMAQYGFSGSLDEIRVSNIVRNASWLSATYDTIYSPSTFLIIGIEEESILHPILSDEKPADNSTAVSVLTYEVSVTINQSQGKSFNVSICTIPPVDAGDKIYTNRTAVTNGTFTGQISPFIKYQAQELLKPNATYIWYVNTTYSGLWTNATYTFVTRDNFAPNATNEDPVNNSNVSISIGRFYATLTDREGGNFNWTMTLLNEIGEVIQNQTTEGLLWYTPSRIDGKKTMYFSRYNATCDFNADNYLNNHDVDDIVGHYGETGAPGWIPEDLNPDGNIDVSDISIFFSYLGTYQNLQPNMKHTVWVNMSDAYGWNNQTFYFRTTNYSTPMYIYEQPPNGQMEVSRLTENVHLGISSLGGTNFDWYIETSRGDSNFSINATNGTMYCPLGSLPMGYDENVTWWVNSSDDYVHWNNVSYWFVTEHDDPPAFSNEDPANTTINVPRTKTNVSINISDPEGHTFNWSIETSRGDSDSGVGATNGTFVCALGSLPMAYDLNITWWVNCTDQYGGVTNATYWFETQHNYLPVQTNELVANGSTGATRWIAFPLSVDISDQNAHEMNWTIETSEGDNSSGTNFNETIECTISIPLPPTTNITWWVNVTDGIGWTNATYWFITEASSPPTIESPSPANRSVNLSKSTGFVSVYINCTTDQFDWSIETSEGDSASGHNGNGNWGCSVAFPIPYSTNVTWWVNVTNGYNVTNATYWFTIEPNYAPVQSNENPLNNSVNVSTTIGVISINISDNNSDTMSWSIETSTGDSNLGSGATNGTIYCYPLPFVHNTTITWWVNVTDGTAWTNATYSFTTEINHPPTIWWWHSTANQNVCGVHYGVGINDTDGDGWTCYIDMLNYTGVSPYTVGNDTYYAYCAFLCPTGTYTFYVNVTDGFDWTRGTVNITIVETGILVHTTPTPANRSTGVSIYTSTFTMRIVDDLCKMVNWSIESSTGDNSTGYDLGGWLLNYDIGITFATPLPALTNITIWVNATDGVQTKHWTYWFITNPQFVVTLNYTYDSTIRKAYFTATVNSGASTLDYINWDFGDGYGLGEFSLTPTHTYRASGDFYVTLWVENRTTKTQGYGTVIMSASLAEEQARLRNPLLALDWTFFYYMIVILIIVVLVIVVITLAKRSGGNR